MKKELLNPRLLIINGNIEYGLKQEDTFQLEFKYFKDIVEIIKQLKPDIILVEGIVNNIATN